MSRHYYKKEKNKKKKIIFRIISLVTSLAGLLVILYIFFPLALWQIYFVPVFASSSFALPIPKTTLVSSSTIGSLISTGVESISVDYSNAQNWFPGFSGLPVSKTTSSYTISIPKINIQKATVSSTDYDLSSHLVNYPGTAIPPESGNAVIFGHSTLPALFNKNNYKTIFATLHTIKAGDEITIDLDGIVYAYEVFSISVVDAQNTSIFSQDYDNSYLTLVTCTPPGTVWKRLIVKARLIPLKGV